jgi:hypothetical protein
MCRPHSRSRIRNTLRCHRCCCCYHRLLVVTLWCSPRLPQSWWETVFIVTIQNMITMLYTILNSKLEQRVTRHCTSNYDLYKIIPCITSKEQRFGTNVFNMLINYNNSLYLLPPNHVQPNTMWSVACCTHASFKLLSAFPNYKESGRGFTYILLDIEFANYNSNPCFSYFMR